MKKTLLIAALAASACSAPRPSSITPKPAPSSTAELTTTSAQTALTLCRPEDFGAVAGDGADDRVAIQAAYDACPGGTVAIDGAFDVVTPNPRPPGMYAMLKPREGTRTVWTTASAVIRASGDNEKRDYRLWQVVSGNEFERPVVVTNFTPGTTVEQTHVWRVDSKTRGVRIHHGSCTHPAREAKSGDCFQVACYEPLPDGSNDNRCWDVRVDHMTFVESGRSCVAVHSGLHGTRMADGHYTTRFDHNLYMDCSDQQWDGEGSGGTSGVEIDHSTFLTPRNRESAIAIQVQASNVWIHDNKFDGRGIDLYGCVDGCLLSDNVGVQRFSAPFVTLRKAGSNVTFADERYTMEASAGGQPAISISQKITAPDHVRVTDTALTQLGNGVAVLSAGTVGLYLQYLDVVYGGPNSALPAIVVTGSGSAGCPTDGVVGIRADETVLLDSKITGPYKFAVSASGSYCGSGSFDIERNTGASVGLSCSGVATGAGIRGPVIYSGNSAPAFCQPLVP